MVSETSETIFLYLKKIFSMFNILDIEAQFTKQKINKAKKLIVREFEEEKKNHFICFVDGEEESYDVKIELNNKREIINASCDCGSDDFCLHQLALSLFIFENKQNKTTSQRTAKKKISETEIAMENLNSEEMKTWLLDFFKKNKDAEIQFLLDFGEKKSDFSDEEIIGIIKKTIESVAGKKKNLTAQDVKKIVDLLAKSLEPVEHFLYQTNNKELGVEKYFCINEEITNFQMNIFTSSTRIEKYLENFKERFTSNFNATKDFELWKKLAEKYWNVYLKGQDSLRFYLYHFIIEMYHSGSKEQKLFIAGLVKKNIELWMKNDVHLRVSLKEDLLPILVENNFLVPLLGYFPVVRYENSYNIKVINEIVKIDQSKAEEACKAVIKSNTNEKYNIPYYLILEKLYKDKKDLQGLAFIKRKKFMYDYSLEDYIFIEQNEKDRGEFKKFRNKILASLRVSFTSDSKYIELYFEILEHENNYKKMIEVLNNYIPSSVINKYCDKLFLYDKNKFLNIFKARVIWGDSDKDDEAILSFLIAKYDSAVLKDFFSKSNFGFGSGKFAQLVLDRLKA